MKTNEYTTMLKSYLAKASYPLTGNLSEKIRNNLEEILGRNIYCANSAFEASLATNIITYPVATAAIASIYGSNMFGVGAMSFGWAVFELLGRVGELGEGLDELSLNSCHCKKSKSYDPGIGMPGSLLGEIVSIPLEILVNKYERNKFKKYEEQCRKNRNENQIRKNIKDKEEGNIQRNILDDVLS